MYVRACIRREKKTNKVILRLIPQDRSLIISKRIQDTASFPLISDKSLVVFPALIHFHLKKEAIHPYKIYLLNSLTDKRFKEFQRAMLKVD